MKFLFVPLLLLATCVAQTAATSAGKQKILWQKLEANIVDIDQHLDGVMGVAIEDLTNGDHYFLHEDEVVAQASSIKITVLANLYLQAQQGKLKLSDLYTVQASDLVQDSDIMNGLTPGVTRVTLRDLATMMVAVSDNAATNVLIERVGMQNVNAMLDSLGLKSYTTSPQNDGSGSCKKGKRKHFDAARNDDDARRYLSRKGSGQGFDREFLQNAQHEQGFVDSS